MSTTTTNLGLFKYNTTTDANVAFDINTALNDNWDKIDVAMAGASLPDQTGKNGYLLTTNGTTASWVQTSEIHCIVDTYIEGTSWYRIWSDGWCEQGSLYYKGSSCQGNNTIEFLLPFKNISYTLTGMPFHTSTSYDLCEVYASRTTSSTVLYIGSAVFGFMWKVCGYIAEE